MTDEQRARFWELNEKFKKNRVSKAEIDELDHLEGLIYAEKWAQEERKPINGWWSLPIAETCWNADARHIEG